MHAAIVIVQKILRPVSAQLDRRNARNLVSAVQALIRGRRLTLMELARHWPEAERVSGPLKRLDRLLGNGHVQALRTRFYAAAAAWLVRSAQPVLIVDWSESAMRFTAMTVLAMASAGNSVDHQIPLIM